MQLTISVTRRILACNIEEGVRHRKTASSPVSLLGKEGIGEPPMPIILNYN
jgi:hypothetical protein